MGTLRAVTSTLAGQPAAVEEPQEPTPAAGQPVAAGGLQKRMPAAGHPAAAEEPQEPPPAAGQPEQQAGPARKRQWRAVKPGRRAAGAAAEPVEDAAASRQLAVLAPPRERGSTRSSLATSALEQESNVVSNMA